MALEVQLTNNMITIFHLELENLYLKGGRGTWEDNVFPKCVRNGKYMKVLSNDGYTLFFETNEEISYCYSNLMQHLREVGFEGTIRIIVGKDLGTNKI